MTNEYIYIAKTRFTKLRDWKIAITLKYEKTLLQSMVDKKVDDKDAQELKKLYNHSLDKRTDIMKTTQFKEEGVFGDTLGNESVSPEQ